MAESIAIESNFHFSVVSLRTLGVNISGYGREKSLILGWRVGRIGQHSVTYKTHVAMQCGYSIATAD